MSLTLFIGPMFSSKTLNLVVEVTKQTYAGRDVIAIKWHKDARYADKNKLASGSGLMLKNEDKTETRGSIKIENATFLKDVDKIVQPYPVVVVDEVQFFEDAPIFCDLWANQGKHVIVSGLNGTASREPWPVISQLIARADNIHKLSAVCLKCKSTTLPANFTECFVFSTSIILEGSSESYRATCRKCWKAPPGTSTKD